MKTLLVCVGTGGIFYHGLSRMATFCHRRGDTDVLLIDPDKVEERLKFWRDLNTYSVSVGGGQSEFRVITIHPCVRSE